jgi:AcrR family transcriptional regulator
MDKETSQKIKVAEAAADRYIENQRFTIQSLAKELKMKPETIYSLFPNRSSILRYYYTSRILICRDMNQSIDGYDEFSLSEKLSNFFLTLIDLFGDKREFVLTTYREFVVCSVTRNKFEAEFKDEIRNIFLTDDKIAASSRIFLNSFLWHAIYLQFHALMKFWKEDESRNYENSMALIDKWSSLTQEAFYSKVLDKSFDLGKFLFYQSSFSQCAMNTNNERREAV